ncbi:hypothetical protein RHGRI_027863 [Rhododendron griersonianum]|uniref:Protein SGT1 homolog n=1 Tax=Rhododendron griersonianum TaxID=479676 RepID=A0AAV6J528_9ERIC|nr:hypothetical protein RHGRI_027863 [Rhododendron griersonianum]
MASDLETRAKEAFIDDHFELAVDLYSQAIAMEPANAELFADRAQANLKLNNFTEAVADANKAIELDPSMAKAYLRKGNACIKLEEYQTAKAALEVGASLAPGNARFTNLIKECDERLAEENVELPKQSLEKPSTDGAISPASESTDKTVETTQDSKAVVSSAKPRKYRHEFYQKPEEAVVTIFAKGVPHSSVSVDFGEQILSVTIDVPGEDAYTFVPRLFGKIIPAKCKYEVLSTKIEIRLAKAEAIQWTSLEFSKDITVLQKINVSTVAQRPSYPSSNPGKKDWDSLEAQVKKEVESNGTVLSTNWKEVGSKKVEGSPPEGMEVKKWEY